MTEVTKRNTDQDQDRAQMTLRSRDMGTDNSEVSRVLENVSVENVQRELSELIEHQLKNDEGYRDYVTDFLRETQVASLHLENPDSLEKRPINVGLSPVVISNEQQAQAARVSTAVHLVRNAVLLRMQEDPRLQAFFEDGVDPLAVEIMRACKFEPMPANWRVRLDMQAASGGGEMYMIEQNGGEPQGDGILSDAARVGEAVVAGLFGMGQDEVQFGPYPEDQMMKVMKARFRMVTGENRPPVVGYLAWKGRSSLSHAEARYTAERYEEKFGQDSVAFEPTDVVDIQKRVSTKGKEYYVWVVENEGKRSEVEIVRRLHGEPFENMDLWEGFRVHASGLMCSDDEQTLWERFISSEMAPQMINPLNSWATDKKIDAIMGNADYLREFGIWEKVEELMDPDGQYRDKLHLPSFFTEDNLDEIVALVEKSFPKSHMLHDKDSEVAEGLGLSDEDVDYIKSHREEFVLKRDTLVGHSGTSVHVGRGVDPSEIDKEDFLALPEETLEAMTGMGHEEFEDVWRNGLVTTDNIVGEIMMSMDGSRTDDLSHNAQVAIRRAVAKRVEDMDSESKKTVLDQVWSALIEQSLKSGDALLQEAVPQFDVPVVMLDDEGNVVADDFHFDFDPQGIGATMTYPVIRLTKAAKTNITGGYGGLGVPISEGMARWVLAEFAKQDPDYGQYIKEKYAA